LAKGVGGGHEEALESWQQIAKARRGKLPARKRRNVSRTVRRPRSTGTGQEAKVTRLDAVMAPAQAFGEGWWLSPV